MPEKLPRVRAAGPDLCPDLWTLRGRLVDGSGEPFVRVGSDHERGYAGLMRLIDQHIRWSWDAFIMGLLGVSVALSLLPDGPWLIPLDAIAGGLLLAGLVRSVEVVFFWDRT